MGIRYYHEFKCDRCGAVCQKNGERLPVHWLRLDITERGVYSLFNDEKTMLVCDKCADGMTAAIDDYIKGE